MLESYDTPLPAYNSGAPAINAKDWTTALSEIRKGFASPERVALSELATRVFWALVKHTTLVHLATFDHSPSFHEFAHKRLDPWLHRKNASTQFLEGGYINLRGAAGLSFGSWLGCDTGHWWDVEKPETDFSDLESSWFEQVERMVEFMVKGSINGSRSDLVVDLVIIPSDDAGRPPDYSLQQTAAPLATLEEALKAPVPPVSSLDSDETRRAMETALEGVSASDRALTDTRRRYAQLLLRHVQRLAADQGTEREDLADALIPLADAFYNAEGPTPFVFSVYRKAKALGLLQSHAPALLEANFRLLNLEGVENFKKHSPKFAFDLHGMLNVADWPERLARYARWANANLYEESDAKPAWFKGLEIGSLAWFAPAAGELLWSKRNDVPVQTAEVCLLGASVSLVQKNFGEAKHLAETGLTLLEPLLGPANPKLSRYLRVLRHAYKALGDEKGLANVEKRVEGISGLAPK